MESRLTAGRVEGLSTKEKILTNMDNSVVIAWGGSIRGLNANGKKHNNSFLKENMRAKAFKQTVGTEERERTQAAAPRDPTLAALTAATDSALQGSADSRAWI